MLYRAKTSFGKYIASSETTSARHQVFTTSGVKGQTWKVFNPFNVVKYDDLIYVIARLDYPIYGEYIVFLHNRQYSCAFTNCPDEFIEKL